MLRPRSRMLSDTPPHSLGCTKDVLEPSALTIYADPHVDILELVGKGCAGELSLLMGVEDPQGRRSSARLPPGLLCTTR